MEDPRVELGLKDFQSSARTGYTNLPKQDTLLQTPVPIRLFSQLWRGKWDLNPYNSVVRKIAVCVYSTLKEIRTLNTLGLGQCPLPVGI